MSVKLSVTHKQTTLAHTKKHSALIRQKHLCSWSFCNIAWENGFKKKKTYHCWVGSQCAVLFSTVTLIRNESHNRLELNMISVGLGLAGSWIIRPLQEPEAWYWLRLRLSSSVIWVFIFRLKTVFHVCLIWPEENCLSLEKTGGLRRPLRTLSRKEEKEEQE